VLDYIQIREKISALVIIQYFKNLINRQFARRSFIGQKGKKNQQFASWMNPAQRQKELAAGVAAGQKQLLVA
jgi:hypothetical protein